MTVDERFAAHAREWGVTVEEIRTTETSQIGFGRRGKQPVVLKVIRKEGNEEWLCGKLLEAFAGSGVISPIAHAPGAVLLPRLMPGHDLVSLCLAGRGFIPIDFVDRAAQLFVDLSATQSNIRLLHGDLHHYNVLFDSNAGWVVIDPQGPMGEIEFEIGASLRNPAMDLVGDPRVLERRLRLYEERLEMNAERALKWAFATTVLGILWPFEQGVGLDLRAPFAAAAHAMHVLLR